MAVTDQQKLDFLLKKIGFTKTKTGSTVGTGAISGTPKQPFAEAIPSPLIIANGALWNESDKITTTPPGSDTNQIKVYSTSSALRMTADATSSGQRAYIAYSTYNDTSSTRLTNWIDTQFGALYLIKVYKGDPNSGGVALSAGATNENWFFDYSAGVLNFNDSNVPSGVTDTNIYIVGYRYIGQTGAPTPGISTYSFLDLTVERNLDVGVQGGISTFRNNIDLNADLDVDGHTNLDNVNIVGVATHEGNVLPSADATYDLGSPTKKWKDIYFHNLVTTPGGPGFYGDDIITRNLKVNGISTFIGDASFSGNVSIGGTLTYEDVINVDSVGIITARSGIRVTGGVIEALAGENKIPSLYATMGSLPSAGTYHGMFAHVHNQGKGYFAHAGAWYELVNKELNGRVGTGTESYFIDRLVSTSTTATSLNIAGVSTFAGEIDANGRIVGAQLANVIPFYYDYVSQFPSASTYHGAVAHAHNTGRLYFAHAGWKELVNKESDGRVGLGTENYFINSLVSTSTTATSLNVTGVTTAVTVDINGDLDVDGHTNLDNVNIVGVTTHEGHVLPSADSTYDLGSSSKYWRHIYADNVTGGGGGVIIGDDIITRNLKVNGISTFIGIATFNNATFHDDVTFNGDIDVDGHTNLDNISVAGVTTFTGTAEFDGNAKFDSTITAGGATGTNGQYLKSTGSGVAWGSFPTLRTRDTVTASSGQTTFTFNYAVNFLDVYVNGIKLTDAEFTATNGTSVVLAVGCFVGDIVELVSYNPISVGSASGSLNNIVEDITPQLGGNLDLFSKTIEGTGGINITGVITATTFIGDGSGLTGIVASGTGVVIKDGGSTVGTAGTINFGDNLSVSPISSGIVTVTAANTQLSTEEVQDIVGAMFSGNTETNITATYQDSDGTIDLVASSGITTAEVRANTLVVTGVSTFTGNVDINGDLDIDGHTELDNVNVAGVVTATTLKGAVQGTSGTFSSNVDITGDLRVGTGLTVVGVSTFNNDVDFGLYGAGAPKITFDESGDLLWFKKASAGGSSSKIGLGGGTSYDHLQLQQTYTGGGQSEIIAYNSKILLATYSAGKDITLQSTNDIVLQNGLYDGLKVLRNGANNGAALSVELYWGSSNSAGGTGGKKLETDPKGIKVGTGVTIETNGQATYTGIVTAQKFVGDGSLLTGISGSGGVAVQDEGSTLSTQASILNFVGTGVVASGTGATKTITINTGAAQTALTAGNSKVFVNDESTTSNNGSFEIFLSDSTSSGAAHTAFRIYNPSSNTNSAEFFHNNTQIYSRLALKATYAGGTDQQIIFRSTNSNYEGSIVHRTGAGEFNFYNTYQGTQYNPLRISTNQLYTKAHINPLDDNTYDLGYSVGGTNLKWRQIHATNVSAGVVTATTFHGDGSNLTGISGSGGVTVQDEGSTLSTQASTLNFVGSGVVASGTGATKTITINTGGVSDGDKGDIVVSNSGATFTIDNNSITNAKVLGNIAGTKISPDFGSQNVITGGYVQAPVLSALGASGSGDGTILISSGGGQNNDFSRIRQVIADDSFVIENKSSGSYETFFKGNSDRAAELHYQGAKKLETSNTGVTVTGTLSATLFSGSGASLTNLSAANLTGTLPSSVGFGTAIAAVWNVGHQGASNYNITGPGNLNSTVNPDLYLDRGKVYQFNMNASGHGFGIQTVSGTWTGSNAYTTGITNAGASTGVITFSVPHDAPSRLYYACTSFHSGMVGNIYISGGDADRRTTASGTTGGAISNGTAANISITAARTYALLKIQTSVAAWVTLYTDSTSRSNDSSRSETTDPTPGSGVIAEVITTGASTQIMTPGLIGWNNDGTPSPTVYAKVVNKSGSNATVVVTLHYLELEI